ncbi:hypothetical protein OH764_28795 [Burkholderia sp. M6-3]
MLNYVTPASEIETLVSLIVAAVVIVSVTMSTQLRVRKEGLQKSFS